MNDSMLAKLVRDGKLETEYLDCEMTGFETVPTQYDNKYKLLLKKDDGKLIEKYEIVFNEIDFLNYLNGSTRYTVNVRYDYSYRLFQV